MSEHTLGRLQQSAEETEALAGAIRKLRGELGSRSPFLALRTQIEDATAQMKSGDLSGGIEQMASAVEQFMPAVEQMGRELGTIFGDDRLGERIGGVESLSFKLTRQSGNRWKIFNVTQEDRNRQELRGLIHEGVEAFGELNV